MVEEIKNSLQEILTKIDGLYSIMFTDRDGVPLLKVNLVHPLWALINPLPLGAHR